MAKVLRLLYIEDDDADARILERSLHSRARMTVERVRRLRDGLSLIKSPMHTFDAILVDLGLPDVSDPIEVVRRLHQANGTVPLVVVTGLDDEETAMAALREGAQDYILKEDYREDMLFRSIRYAVERMARERSERALRNVKYELDEARDIQQSQFPSSPPALPGFDIAGRCIPALSCGGDYYDFFPMQDGRLVIAVGDVCGHGIGPAIIMASVRSVLRSLAMQHSSVGTIVDLANQMVRFDDWTGRFMTLALLGLDPLNGEIAFAGAGHEAIVLDSKGSRKTTLQSDNVPLGVSDGFGSDVQQVTLQPGEAVLCLTDGIAETSNAQKALFGRQRTLECVADGYEQSALQIVDDILVSARAFGGTMAQNDDMTVVIAKRCLQ